MIPFILKVPFLFVWDTLLCFLWIVIFGIFGNVRIPRPDLPFLYLPISLDD